MFEQTLATGKTNRSWTTAVGFLLQAVIGVVLVIVPMIFPAVIQEVAAKATLIAPPPPPGAPPPPPHGDVGRPRVVPNKPRDPGKTYEPPSVPNKPPVMIIDEPEVGGPPVTGTPGVVGGVPCGGPGQGPCGNTVGGVPFGVPQLPTTPPPPPPPVEKKKQEPQVSTPQRINVGGRVQEANLIHRVVPVYPPLAKQVGVSGTVRLKATISKEGRIAELTAVSGHPLLVKAAIEAVSQWVYRPTMLNDLAVEVDTVIDVNFTLSRQ